MKKVRAIWIGILLITILLTQISCGQVSASTPSKARLPEPTLTLASTPAGIPAQSPGAAQSPLFNREDDAQAILNATVLIRMQSPQMQKIAGLGVFIGSGMGSIIRYNGKILLVTHNHWGEILQDMTIVEFRNADNKMIKPIFGSEFKRLIVYQDAGTLVLQPPTELIGSLIPVDVDTFTQATVGASVEVVHRENPAREKAAIQQAIVEEVSTYKGQPAYHLRSQDGQPIKPGDSGGGIWYNGVLIGNNWVVLVETSGNSVVTCGDSETEAIVYTDVSYAALLSHGIPLGAVADIH